MGRGVDRTTEGSGPRGGILPLPSPGLAERHVGERRARCEALAAVPGYPPTGGAPGEARRARVGGAEVVVEVAEPLMDRLAITGLELVELPAED